MNRTGSRWSKRWSTGLLDVIVSDHNPQDVEAKRAPFAEAEPGAVGLETMLSAGLRLVAAGHVSLPRLLQAMTLRPAEILGLPQGRLAKNAPADLIRFDPAEPYVVEPAKLASRCKNTPFDMARLEGRVETDPGCGTYRPRIGYAERSVRTARSMVVHDRRFSPASARSPSAISRVRSHSACC